ncbi:hypothetical protein SeMB42_g07621 [Synchytrium endobioticum]|uniref:Uncharacterized protein n=1 Tax=Synchytrium endobioticum TaxID=286115 RepID=A0A507C364_9FUNG|nr:hypothetical protein SeMB42_g07621 [Synchytrium endobioticum]TPX39272.1 hypothetical protein SeLEV6574_g07342 [Synchytrium endobioticum]
MYVDLLERKVKEYEMEIKWLRNVLTERDGAKTLHDIYKESGLVLTNGVLPAAADPSAVMVLSLSSISSPSSACNAPNLVTQLSIQTALLPETSPTSQLPKTEGQINWSLK